MIDLIRRASNTVVVLVIATVTACALVHMLAMLAVYGTLLLQGEPMPLNSALLGGAMWVGAMQGGAVLPVVLTLGSGLHVGLMRFRMTGLIHYVGAAMIVTVVALLMQALSLGASTVVTFWIIGAASGVLAGCVFWLIRRPDRDVISAPLQP